MPSTASRPIDLVVVNLYPFEATVARPDVELRGGDRADRHRRALDDPLGGEEPGLRRRGRRPGGLRRGARASCASSGGLGDATRRRLALEAFARTARYDAAIDAWLAARAGQGEDRFPPRLEVELARAATLRYGENPHQGAALYGASSRSPSRCTARSSRTTTWSTRGRARADPRVRRRRARRPSRS